MRTLLAIAILVGAPLAAWAEGPCRDTSRVTMVRGAHGEKVYRFDCAIEVRAKLPQALILLSRMNVGYDEPALEQPLSSRIEQATHNEPF